MKIARLSLGRIGILAQIGVLIWGAPINATPSYTYLSLCVCMCLYKIHVKCNHALSLWEAEQTVRPNQ